MSIGELIDSVDPSLVLELYGTGLDVELHHLGTYYLFHEDSRQELLEEYGDIKVYSKNVYKAYVLVYIIVDGSIEV